MVARGGPGEEWVAPPVPHHQARISRTQARIPLIHRAR